MEWSCNPRRRSWVELQLPVAGAANGGSGAANPHRGCCKVWPPELQMAGVGAAKPGQRSCILFPFRLTARSVQLLCLHSAAVHSTKLRPTLRLDGRRAPSRHSPRRRFVWSHGRPPPSSAPPGKGAAAATLRCRRRSRRRLAPTNPAVDGDGGCGGGPKSSSSTPATETASSPAVPTERHGHSSRWCCCKRIMHTAVLRGSGGDGVTGVRRRFIWYRPCPAVLPAILVEL
jgi:hypothetical protein